MITRLPPSQQESHWQTQLADSFTETTALLDFLALSNQHDQLAQQDFPLRVPRGFAARMRKGDPNDPLLRQVLPIAAENESIAGFSLDPLAETKQNPIPGILHKYHGRALVTLSGVCAVHCRYCFRRHFPYSANQIGRKDWPDIFHYLTEHPDIQEIILSGGDPLLVQDHILAEFIAQLKQQTQIKTLRIHSRLPIVLPARITPALCQLLQDSGLHIVMVTHCNHPQEIDRHVSQAAALLRTHHIHIFNQAVLLHGVNDNIDALRQLSERLWEISVLPYYLHMLDKVQGAAHFAVDVRIAKQLMKKLSALLPGYLVPKLVQELPGAHSKTLI
jgi:L-lysine 2,3-aminomutase